MKYTTAAKIKSLYPDTNLSDAQIDEIIEVVSEYIDSYIGYRLASNYSDTPKSFLFDGSGTDSLVLYFPLNGDLTLEKIDMSNNATSVSNAVFYPLNEPYTAYIGLRSGTFEAGMANYRVSNAKIGRYTIDFVNSSNHTLPRSLEQAINTIAVDIVTQGSLQSQSETTSGIKTSETTGSYSVSWASPTSEMISNRLGSAIPDAKKILDSYKTVNIV